MKRTLLVVLAAMILTILGLLIILLGGVASTSADAAVATGGVGTTVTISYTMPMAQAVRLRDALCARSPLDPCTLALANAQLKSLLVAITASYERQKAEETLEAQQTATPPLDPGN